MTNHPGIRAALIAAAGTLVLMAAACGAKSNAATGDQPGASASPSASVGAGEGTGTNGDAGDPGNGNGGNGNGGTTTSPSRKTSTTPKSSSSPLPGPQIVSFKVTQQPACPAKGPAPGVYYPGQDVILSWTVTGATTVALSVDGPGIYRGDYGQQDMQQLGFGCDTSQPQSKHTYLLTATVSGKTVTKTLTVTAPSNP